MSGINCPNCGADLTASGSVRIAEYRFGRLVAAKQDITEGPGYYHSCETPDTCTLICNACKRLIKTLPLTK